VESAGEAPFADLGRILVIVPTYNERDALPLIAADTPMSDALLEISRKGFGVVGVTSPDGTLAGIITDIMRRKLLRRTRKQKGELSQKDLENIEKRASSAPAELHEAYHFDYVIPNHDGEDSEHWDAFYFPIGDARKALLAFVNLLEGRISSHLEQWDKELI